ncbi:hypothetical protein [Nannocystis sp.]|uniref:hypothetical protein n=1 Tax=Nannocystis sp. TaxID=1962667 RepID=UPI00242990F7|nr:hypothetical protein [Nannocystis sp.]MBK7824929.1 hypothetical protein [Nannocystis sp.]MBK9752817.1 hypothetical protein [Nannocystis sp.]
MLSADELLAPNLSISETKIFARGDGARQWLAYSMHLETAGAVAMILPLPVPAGSPEDAAGFVDLSQYPTLFTDLVACMAGGRPIHDPEYDLKNLFADDAPPLKVHKVGSFVASYVPTLADFSRLDRCFRLPQAIWDQLPGYADWGFAVIQFRPGYHEDHPIGLHFPRRWTDRIYFPTTHVHDGILHDEARFDHMLYYQGMIRPARQGAASERAGWAFARAPTHQFVDLERAAGMVDGEQPLERLRYHGTRPNEDVWLLPV